MKSSAVDHPHHHYVVAIVGVVAIFALMVSVGVVAKPESDAPRGIPNHVFKHVAPWGDKVAQSDFDALEARVAALETQSTAVQTQVAALQSQVTTLQSQLTTLQSQVNALPSGGSGDLATQVAALQAQTAALRTDVTTLQNTPPTPQIVQQITNVQNTITQTQSQVVDIQAQIDAALNCGGGLRLCHGSCMDLGGAQCQ